MITETSLTELDVLLHNNDYHRWNGEAESFVGWALVYLGHVRDTWFPEKSRHTHASIEKDLSDLVVTEPGDKEDKERINLMEFGLGMANSHFFRYLTIYPDFGQLRPYYQPPSQEQRIAKLDERIKWDNLPEEEGQRIRNTLKETIPESARRVKYDAVMNVLGEYYDRVRYFLERSYEVHKAWREFNGHFSKRPEPEKRLFHRDTRSEEWLTRLEELYDVFIERGRDAKAACQAVMDLRYKLMIKTPGGYSLEVALPKDDVPGLAGLENEVRAMAPEPTISITREGKEYTIYVHSGNQYFMDGLRVVLTNADEEGLMVLRPFSRRLDWDYPEPDLGGAVSHKVLSSGRDGLKVSLKVDFPQEVTTTALRLNLEYELPYLEERVQTHAVLNLK